MSPLVKCLKVTTYSPEATQKLGICLGMLARPGDVYLLVGNLGAGKTCLTQGIAWGLGINEHALSPSFVLIRELKGRLPLYHVDLYRLNQLEEVADIGLDDYFYGKGVSVVEWADKAMELLPAENLMVKISCPDEYERTFKFLPNGKRYRLLLSRLRKEHSVEKHATGD